MLDTRKNPYKLYREGQLEAMFSNEALAVRTGIERKGCVVVGPRGTIPADDYVVDQHEQSTFLIIRGVRVNGITRLDA